MSKLLLLAIIGIIAGLLFQKNKIVTVYNAALMWIITGWQYNTADYYNYSLSFRKSASNISLSIFGQPIFYIINLIIKKINDGFQLVYIVCGLIAIIVLLWGISKFTDRINLVLSLFLISTFLLYAVQIRNFVAMSFILMAMSYLVGEKKNINKFIVFIVVAAGFHVTALFYLIFLLIPYLTKIKATVLTVLLCIAAFFSKNVLSSVLISLGMLDYTSSSHDAFTVTVYNLFVLSIILFIIYVCHIIERWSDYYSRVESGSETKNMALEMKKIAIMMLVCVPLQFITIESVRLCRNLFPLFFCQIVRLYPKHYNANIRSLNRLELFSFYAICGMLAYCLMYGNLYIYRQCYETVFLALFKNNLLVA